MITFPHIIYLPHLVYFLHVSLKCNLHRVRGFYLFCSSLYSRYLEQKYVFSDECPFIDQVRIRKGATPEVTPILVTRLNLVQLLSSCQSKDNSKMIL